MVNKNFTCLRLLVKFDQFNSIIIASVVLISFNLFFCQYWRVSSDYGPRVGHILKRLVTGEGLILHALIRWDQWIHQTSTVLTTWYKSHQHSQLMRGYCMCWHVQQQSMHHCVANLHQDYCEKKHCRFIIRRVSDIMWSHNFSWREGPVQLCGSRKSQCFPDYYLAVNGFTNLYETALQFIRADREGVELCDSFCFLWMAPVIKEILNINQDKHCCAIL